MNLLKEKFINQGCHDSQLDIYKIETLPCVQQKAPAFNSGSIGIALKKARSKNALLDTFYKIDGGSDIHCKSRGALFIDKNILTAVFVMEPARDGYKVLGLKDVDSFPMIKMAFDFNHDHYNGILFEFERDAKPRVNAIRGSSGVLASDNDYIKLAPIKSGWKVRQKDLNKKWTLMLTLDLKKFDVDPQLQPTIGFYFQRHQVVMEHIEGYTWPFSRSYPVPPSLFGTLQLSSSPVWLLGIDLRHPIYGKKDTSLLIKNSSRSLVTITCRSRTESDHLNTQYERKAHIKAGEQKKVPLVYECSMIDYRDQRIIFEIETESKKIYCSSFLAGSFYAIGYGGSFLQLKHRYNKKYLKEGKNSKKGDSNFFFKKRNYILSKLPDYHRDPYKPFQYVNVYRNRKKIRRFDVTSQKIFEEVARHIDEMFEDDDDRIIAAMYLIHQSNTWSPSFSTFTSCYDARSMFMVGYNLCGGFSIMLAALLSSMIEKKTGKPFSAHYSSGVKHVICAVGRGKDHIPLDPNTGYFFPNPKTGKLATYSEIRKNKSIVEDVLPGRRDDYLLKSYRKFGIRSMTPFGGPTLKF